MSVLLGLAFLCLAAIAVTAIAVSLKRYVPFIAELRNEFKEPLPTKELRLTVQRATLPAATPILDGQRPRHQPKPIKRLLQARERRAAAG